MRNWPTVWSPGLAAVMRLGAIGLVSLTVSCTETADERTGTESEVAAAPEARLELGPDPASGILAPDARRDKAPLDPRKIGLEPATDIRRDPALAADAPAGKASVYSGRRGRRVDSKRPWYSVTGDGLHDPDTGASQLLQHPAAAFRNFPRANSGNLVDWVAALDGGHIRPRGGRGLQVLDTEIVLADTKNMPHVIFPHRPHTEQLVCGNCHNWLFKKKAGATEINMTEIARGRSCGLCHGKVAFPPTDCFRCHSGPRPRSF